MAEFPFSAVGDLLGSGLGFISAGQSRQQSHADLMAQLGLQSSQFQQNLAAQYHFLDRSEALQREFAKSGIQWRVEDAVKAGVHPLFALGASGASAMGSAFQPGSLASASPGAYESGGQYLKSMGQDLGRALAATQTKEDQFTTTMQQLAVQRGGLENQLLAAQIAKLNQPAQGPGMPSGVSSSAGAAGAAQGQPRFDDPKLGPSVKWQMTPSGGITPMPAGNAPQQFGDIGYVDWMTQNRVLPFFGLGAGPGKDVIQRAWPGATGAYYNQAEGGWFPLYNNERSFGQRVGDFFSGRYGSGGVLDYPLGRADMSNPNPPPIY